MARRRSNKSLDHLNQAKEFSYLDKTPRPKLPPEIIEEILTRLPAESLVKLRCVCKSWKALISHPHFVEKHLQVSTKNNKLTHHRIIFNPRLERLLLRSCHVDHILNSGSCVMGDDFYFSVRPNCRSFEVIGSCNGLVCLAIGYDLAEDIYIWNPCTKESKKFPHKLHCKGMARRLYGFGYDDLNRDYKLVKIVVRFCLKSAPETEIKVEGEVFPMSSCSGRNIKDVPFSCNIGDDPLKHVNRALHWIAFRDPDRHTTFSPLVIITLDLRTETCHEIPGPDFYYCGGSESQPMRMKLDAVGEFLTMVCIYGRSHHDVWLMKEYSIKESWTRLFRIPCLQVPCPIICFPKLIHVGNDAEEILIMHCNLLALYHSKDDKFSTLPSHGFSDHRSKRNQPSAHMEFDMVRSLVSPNVIMGRRHN